KGRSGGRKRDAVGAEEVAMRSARSARLGFVNSGSARPKKIDAIESWFTPLVLLYALISSYLWSRKSGTPLRLSNESACARPMPFSGFFAVAVQIVLSAVTSRIVSDSANGWRCTVA